MSRPRKIHDSQILEVTRRVFLERGLRISTRTLAAEVGVSEGVLFQRYGSKEGLIRAALSLPGIDANQVVAEAVTATNPQEVLGNIAVAILRAFRELLPLYIPFLTQPESDREREWTSRTSPFHLFLDALEQHLKAERHAGRLSIESPYTTSYFIVSALHNAALLETIAGGASSTGINEGTARDWIGVLWSGLQPRDRK
jgi:AcrR family transcriptional regulator